MILKTILRRDKNGLRPLNAISLARVSTVSLHGATQAWNAIKYQQVFLKVMIHYSRCLIIDYGIVYRVITIAFLMKGEYAIYDCGHERTNWAEKS